MAQQQEPEAAHTAQETAETADSPAAVHVAWFVDHRTLGRYLRVLRPLAIGLADELVKITLVREGPGGDDDALEPGIETVHYQRRLFAPRARTVAELARKLSAGKIDLLHALDAASTRLTARVARSAGMKYVVSSHAVGDGASLGTLGGQCAALLASSTAIRNDLVEHHVSAAERIRLMQPGVYRVRSPACFCTSGRTVAIVAGGAMDTPAPWQAVLETFAELRLREYDCLFFIVGSGTGERRTRRLARQLDLLGRVTFIDEQVASQFGGIVKAADVYISAAPSRELDIRTLLAMANGSAVLAAHDTTGDFIVDGQTALVFTPGDQAELTTKLVAMLDDPQATRALAAVALAYVAEHHSPTASLGALSEVYRTATADDARTETA